MSNEDERSIIQSESSLGTSYYENKGKNSDEESTKIDNSTLNSIFERITKLEKDNETFRMLAFDLQQERDELKTKNEELENRVSELETFKESSILGDQERDFQIEEVQKTTEDLSRTSFAFSKIERRLTQNPSKMQNADQQSYISESSLGTYRSQDLNAGENRPQIDDSALQSILQRINKLEKDNQTFRNLAFDLQQERDELKKKNDKLEERVRELEIFKENTILANQERDFQIEDVRKTTECFTQKVEKEMKMLQESKRKVNSDLGEVNQTAHRPDKIHIFGQLSPIDGFGHFFELDTANENDKIAKLKNNQIGISDQLRST
ncbi:Oidioi.mRNA.OKI2018_I69.chr2.g8393.t1.cds [Oikopleura dioica]|uniref:Oidioi.mRNA.OKI2018_I69.chr2.g8393.t1.cds n=1 Tax=Oikopleura dioica TaxID=34765 RepID=A0ABN7TEQ5_OIKDI|nr:Oidioi.mRNA.OKI2018_I69.chr2.g8393.t1.cds [Oikopleura dioica]